MFDANIWADPVKTSVFYTFATTLRQKVKAADPTDSHHFISHLRDTGKLVRCYTQNIDEIEEKVGLATSLELGPGHKGRFSLKNKRASLKTEVSTVSSVDGDGPKDAPATPRKDPGVECVYLHGSLNSLRCFMCHQKSDWDGDRENATLQGQQPACPHCEGATAARQERGKRALGVGKLRPDIVLYGEDHPSAHLISPIIQHDISLAPDLVLILGTSLRVHGLKVMVKEFAKAVHNRGGKVVFVNFTKPPDSVWADVIDYWVQWDCDAWVQDLKEKKPILWLPPGTVIKPERRPPRAKKTAIEVKKVTLEEIQVHGDEIKVSEDEIKVSGDEIKVAGHEIKVAAESINAIAEGAQETTEPVKANTKTINAATCENQATVTFTWTDPKTIEAPNLATASRRRMQPSTKAAIPKAPKSRKRSHAEQADQAEPEEPDDKACAAYVVFAINDNLAKIGGRPRAQSMSSTAKPTSAKQTRKGPRHSAPAALETQSTEPLEPVDQVMPTKRTKPTPKSNDLVFKPYIPHSQPSLTEVAASPPKPEISVVPANKIVVNEKSSVHSIGAAVKTNPRKRKPKSHFEAEPTLPRKRTAAQPRRPKPLATAAVEGKETAAVKAIPNRPLLPSPLDQHMRSPPQVSRITAPISPIVRFPDKEQWAEDRPRPPLLEPAPLPDNHNQYGPRLEVKKPTTRTIFEIYDPLTRQLSRPPFHAEPRIFDRACDRNVTEAVRRMYDQDGGICGSRLEAHGTEVAQDTWSPSEQLTYEQLTYEQLTWKQESWGREVDRDEAALTLVSLGGKE